MIQNALMFVVGAWAFQQMPSLPSVWWGLVLIPLIATVFVARRLPVILYALLCLTLAFALGFCWVMSMAHWRLADELPSQWEQKNIEIVGVIASLPQHTERGTRLRFDVEKVLTTGAQVPNTISLAHYVQDFTASTTSSLSVHRTLNPNITIPDYRAGERWRLTVKLKRPHTTYNPHGFDFEVWALERNIRATGTIKSNGHHQRLSAFVCKPSTLIERAREMVAQRMQTVLAGKAQLPVLKALAIGDDDSIALSDWQVFLNTGTNHLMSISGLHITMLSGLVYALVRILWRRQERLCLALPAHKAATLIGLIFAFAYALLAGFSIPTQRTLYMLIVFAFALWLNRPIALSKVLAYALLVVVLLDPWAVIAAGFWLSFSAVAIMAYALNARLARVNWFKELVLSQWAVTLGLLPFLLVMFGQASMISPVANALAIPMISLLVVPLTLLGALLPLDWALHLAHHLMVFCMQALTWMASLPLANWQQQSPPAWTFVIAVIGLLYAFLPKGVPLKWMGYLSLLPMLLIKPIPPAYGAMQVVVLDVGQGLATVIKTQQHTLLYDTGAQYSAESDAGGRVILPYLRGEGVTNISGLVLSHDDNDHTGGAASIMAQMPVSWVLSSLSSVHPLLQGQQHQACVAGQVWQWDGVQFEILYPALQGEANMSDNNRSCVLKVTSQYGSILLAGDIEKEAEQVLISGSQLANLSADVLVVPHHGSKTSSTQAFVAAVNPGVAISTTGYLNRFKHPKSEVVNRYLEQGASHYQSDHSGAVIIAFNKANRYETSAWRRLKPRYWHDVY